MTYPTTDDPSQDSTAAQMPKQSNGLWKPIALLGGVLLMLVLAWGMGLGDSLRRLQDFIHQMGAWGLLVFIVIYVVATLLALPGTALGFIAGAVFGTVMGSIAVSIGSTVGASLCFLIARYIAREPIRRWLSRHPSFERLDDLSERKGAWVVALTRLVPLFPFNMLNYGLGLTQVRFLTYVFWSWLCMLPGTVSFVMVADAASRGVSQGAVPWGLLGVLVVVVVGLLFLVRFAKNRLRDESDVVSSKNE